METLNTIQALSKIGKVLSKIIYICCIVGIICCAVGIIAFSIGGQTLKLGGFTLHGFLQTTENITEGTVIATTAAGMILCIGEYFVSRMAYRYFENELKDGTPFTERGAKELLHLGISVIWIPIVSAVSAQIVQEIITRFAENAEKISLDNFESVALGVAFIFVSLLCKYGAQLNENSNKSFGFQNIPDEKKE